MLIDLQLSRRLVAWGLGIAFFAPFLFCLGPEPLEEHREFSTVTGRVTYAGYPIKNMCICIDSHGTHSALGSLGDDGSFRLLNFQYREDGTLPGRYRAHLNGYANAPNLPAKYRDSGTSGLEIDVGSDWNHVDIDLH